MCGREEECRVYDDVLLWGPRFDSRAVHLEFAEYRVAQADFLPHISAFVCWYDTVSTPYSYIFVISAI
jgi:hypothetical protein